ncbi:hypothetical protein PCANB_000923 [Pneumocystis canis]|nr:hypothetical protein PCANB_000923 [Pneumocystis canis]
MPVTETDKTIELIFKERELSPEITHTPLCLNAYNPINTPACKTADYLEHKLNQLVHSEQNEESDAYIIDSEKKEITSSSNASLLTMFLTSPLKTTHQESLGLDLLSDHGSTSGYSTPTPPLLLHFAQRPSVKFAASTVAPRAAVHEFIHELPSILQSSCFQHGLHTDPVIERSQHHVRFQATQQSTPTVQTTQMNDNTGILMRHDRLKEKPIKPMTKILLDHVFPKEKMNFIIQEEDKQEELDDSDLEGLDDLETSLDDLSEQSVQKNTSKTSGNVFCQKKVKRINKRHRFLESASYQSIISTSYDPLKKYLMPSIDDINQCIKSLSVSSCKQIDFQDDMDLILGHLDEDQFNAIDSVSYTRTSTGGSKGTSQYTIDPTFPSSDTDESNDSTCNSLFEGWFARHFSPPLRIKNPEKASLIKSLPGRKKDFYQKPYSIKK